MFKFISPTYHYHKQYFFTFLLLGIGTTLIYFTLFALLWYGLKVNHIMAVSLAYICAAAYQFFANRKITFKVKGSRLVQEIIRYMSLLIMNYLIAVLLVQLSIALFHSPLLGLIATAFITPLTGYLVFHYWVFKPVPPQSNSLTGEMPH